MPDSAKIVLNVFDGTRHLMKAGAKVLVTLRDGSQKIFLREERVGPTIPLDVPFYNNLADNYAVIAFIDGYEQAGFYPVRVSPSTLQIVDLMLLPRKGDFKFHADTLAGLRDSFPKLFTLLSAGVDSTVAESRFEKLARDKREVLAAFFNIATAMDTIHLQSGTPLDYLKQVIWEELAEDRIFGWAERDIIDQVRAAAEKHMFEPEIGSAIFHPGATLSWKEVRFGEANVQLTFHENDECPVPGKKWVKIEPDIDYYKDTGAHAILEVMKNKLTQTLTNPRQVYVLRWIAGRCAGRPEFNPPYVIA